MRGDDLGKVLSRHAVHRGNLAAAPLGGILVAGLVGSAWIRVAASGELGDQLVFALLTPLPVIGVVIYCVLVLRRRLVLGREAVVHEGGLTAGDRAWRWAALAIDGWERRQMRLRLALTTNKIRLSHNGFVIAEVAAAMASEAA